MMSALRFGFLSAVCIYATLASDRPSVTLSGKTVRGLYMKVEQQTISAYLGVPFAKAERFNKPTLLEEYIDEVDASKLAKSCMQTPDSYFPGFRGSEMWNSQDMSEDCLSLNIWVPQNPNGDVIVWIYGGGFFSGSPSLALYNGSVLAANTKAIVVDINYRVGPFGFFYLGDDSNAPGNVGLLDQQIALQWINKNIDKFGGKADKVTLFGESAGGASVTSHLLAPDSHNLFSRIIVNSGTTRNVWATRSPCTMLYFSIKTAEELKCADSQNELKVESDGCSVVGAENIYECLKTKQPNEVQDAADKMYDYMQPMEWPFGPITEDKIFFKGDVRRKFVDGDYKTDVSAIFGTVKDEGTFWLPYYLSESGFAFYHEKDPNGPENEAKIDEANYTKSLESFKDYFANSSEAMKILEDGFKNGHNGDAMYRDGVARFVGDFFFTCSVVEFVDHVAKNITSIYMYYFTQRSSANPWPNWMGVMHGYEIEYEFGYPFINSTDYKKANDDKKVSKDFMDLIEKFVNSGSFDEKEWPNYNGQKKIMVIGGDSHKKIVGPDIQQKYCDVINEAKQAIKVVTESN